MNVVVTLVVLVFAALWAAAVYARLVRLRAGVKTAWTNKDRETYSKLAQTYNATLASFPGNLVGGVAGFKPAKAFDQ